MRRHFYFAKTHKRSSRKFFLQIILFWLLSTTTSLHRTIEWATIQGQYYIVKKHFKSFNKHFHQIHPDLAVCYYNIGTTYSNMHDGSKALFYCKIALEMFEKTLGSSHPFIVESYNTIAGIYKNLGEFSKALPFSQRAVDIEQRFLHPNHPQLEAYMTTLKYIQERLNHS